jgi:hypothetical protein
MWALWWRLVLVVATLGAVAWTLRQLVLLAGASREVRVYCSACGARLEGELPQRSCARCRQRGAGGFTPARKVE